MMEAPICDYSLELYRSVPAAVGEQYTLNRFPSGTMGFIKPDNSETACCMTDGALLTLSNISEQTQHSLHVGPVEEVTFTRIQASGHAHRDAVRFHNGKEVLLQVLNHGVTAQLLGHLADLDVRPSAPEAPAAHSLDTADGYSD